MRSLSPGNIPLAILGVSQIDFGGRDERLGPGSSPASLSFASHRLTIKQSDDVVQIPPRMNL